MNEPPPSSGQNRRPLARQFALNFVAGGGSAALARTLVAPIDRCKLLLQNQHAQRTIDPADRYRGIGDAFRRVVREQGVWALWRGNAVNVARILPIQALNFAFKDIFKVAFFRDFDKKREFWRFFAANLVSGGAAGACSLMIVYPLDFARSRLALDIGRTIEEREFRNFWHCVSTIVRSDGVRGLYSGFVSSVQGIIIYRAVYFGSFDTIVGVLVEDRRQLSFLYAWLIGQASVVSAGLVSFPWDTVRRRMMMQSGRKDILYRSTLHCWRRIYAEESARGFFKGAGANVLRGMGSALVLAFYNECAKHF